MSTTPHLEVCRSLTSRQVQDLLDLYANEWWTRERTLAGVERMLAATDLLFGVVDTSSGRLVAFARVLTDHTYLALILDVIVAPGHRGCGLGRLLLDHICGDPSLENVSSIELVCQPEHVSFYQRWGFSENVGRSRLLRRTARAALSGPPDTVRRTPPATIDETT